MHMLIACLSGLGAALLVPFVAPHYAPMAETMGISLCLIGLLASWITIREGS